MGHIVKSHGHIVPAVVMDARAQAAAILDAARAEAEGVRASAYDEGRATAAAELTSLLAAARAEADALVAAATPAALAIAAKMAEKIVGRAVTMEPEIMAEIAAQAVAACRPRGGMVTLRVHPDDLPQVALRESALSLHLGADAVLELVADESVDRFGCVVDTPVGRVDARLSTQLAALRRVLEASDG
jgi:flagellar biosynthesis/type III secretory pathway protein FliH